MPSLLHIADVHLGARHADMGVAAVRQRERQAAAFERAIDEGLKANVEVALVCGDLFDSNAQPRRTVESAVAQLRRLTDRGAHVAIIPGTHDVYDKRSIYRAFDLRAMAGLPPGSDRLRVLTPEEPELVLGDLDLVLYGRVFAAKRAPRSPLAGFDVRNDDRARWKVGLIHGSRRIPGRVEADDVLFTDEEVAASGLDYLALGHWHSFSSGRAGRTTWAYAGAPEPVAVDQDGAGDVCLVHLEDSASSSHSVRVERIRVGRTVFRAQSIDVAGIESGTALVAQLRELADPDLVLAVSLEGVAPDTLEVDPDEVERELAPSFLHVRVRDRSVSALSDGPDLPADTVPGRFVFDLRERLAAAEAKGDAEAVERARHVLRLGRRLLLDDPDHVTLP